MKWGPRSRRHLKFPPQASPASGFGDVTLSSRCPATLGPPRLTGTHVSLRRSPARGVQWPPSPGGNAGLRAEGFTVGEKQDHPNSSSKREEEKKYFSASSACTLRQRPAPGMPGPQLTSLSLPARARGRLSPLRDLPRARRPSARRRREAGESADPPSPAPAGRSPPRVRLPSLLQFGG